MNIQQMSYNTQADWMITVITFKCIHPYFWMNKLISCKRYKSFTTIEKYSNNSTLRMCVFVAMGAQEPLKTVL